MTCLTAARKTILIRCAVGSIVFAAMCLPPAVPASSAQTKSPGNVMQMRNLTTADIMTKVRRQQTTPISQKLSAGEVGTVNDQEVKCYKKRAGGLVQVRCPDIMVVETK